MNEKRAAICKMTFISALTEVNYKIGRLTVIVPSDISGVVLPVSSTELSEEKNDAGNFVNVELKAQLTDTSAESENRLISASFRYGMFILDYTDGTRRLLGTPDVPVLMTYSKSGLYAAFSLSITAKLPEFSKQILN